MLILKTLLGKNDREIISSSSCENRHFLILSLRMLGVSDRFFYFLGRDQDNSYGFFAGMDERLVLFTETERSRESFPFNDGFKYLCVDFLEWLKMTDDQSLVTGDIKLWIASEAARTRRKQKQDKLQRALENIRLQIKEDLPTPTRIAV